MSDSRRHNAWDEQDVSGGLDHGELDLSSERPHAAALERPVGLGRLIFGGVVGASFLGLVAMAAMTGEEASEEEVAQAQAQVDEPESDPDEVEVEETKEPEGETPVAPSSDKLAKRPSPPEQSKTQAAGAERAEPGERKVTTASPPRSKSPSRSTSPHRASNHAPKDTPKDDGSVLSGLPNPEELLPDDPPEETSPEDGDDQDAADAPAQNEVPESSSDEESEAAGDSALPTPPEVEEEAPSDEAEAQREPLADPVDDERAEPAASEEPSVSVEPADEADEALPLPG